MADQVWRGRGVFNEVVQKIEHSLPYTGLTCEMVFKVVRNLGDVNIALMTFEKYFMRNNSRTSMSVMVTEQNEMITVDATASGGSESVLFKFDWGSSNNFISRLHEILVSIGFSTSFGL